MACSASHVRFLHWSCKQSNWPCCHAGCSGFPCWAPLLPGSWWEAQSSASPDHLAFRLLVWRSSDLQIADLHRLKFDHMPPVQCHARSLFPRT